MADKFEKAEEILRSINLTPWRRKLIKTGVVFVVLLVLMGGIVPRFLVRVGPGEVGVKTVNIPFFGRAKGVQQKVYGPIRPSRREHAIRGNKSTLIVRFQTRLADTRLMEKTARLTM